MTVILAGMNIAAVPLLVLLFPAAPALAGSCAGMEDLLTFITIETGHPVPADCPAVERSDQLDGTSALRSQVGAYVPATGRILLAHDLDTATVLGRSYLLHELVHAAQYRIGAEAHVICEAELEAEAYRIQTAWLRQHGEFREAMLLDWAAESLGRCTGDAPMEY
jgi:hypothetical protein